jgi:hypothetical protein
MLPYFPQIMANVAVQSSRPQAFAQGIDHEIATGMLSQAALAG